MLLPIDDSVALDPSDDGGLVVDRNELVFSTLDDVLKLLPAFARGGTSALRDAWLQTWGQMSATIQARYGFLLGAQESPRFAEGLWLDLFGTLFNKPRTANESDVDYRARLLIQIDIVTPTAIKTAVNAALVQFLPNFTGSIIYQEPSIDAAYMAPATTSDPVNANSRQQWTNPPANLLLAVQGPTAATAITYAVVSRNALGTSQGALAATTTAPATLTAANNVVLSWVASPGAVSYDVYRTVTAGLPASIGLIGNTTGISFTDTGLAGNAATPPTVNTTGTIPVWSSWIQPQVPIPAPSFEAGTIQLSNGSASVVGTGTAFSTNWVGKVIGTGATWWGIVQSVTSATAMQLLNPASITVAAAPFTITSGVYLGVNFRLWATYPDIAPRKVGAFVVPANSPEFWIVVPGSIGDDSLTPHCEQLVLNPSGVDIGQQYDSQDFLQGISGQTTTNQTVIAPSPSAYGYIAPIDSLLDKIRSEVERRRAGGVLWAYISDLPTGSSF